MTSTTPETELGVPALKEWAVIVQALVTGEQVLDLRKGGLHEDGRHFALRSTRCWLYPTSEHQRDELVAPAYRHWLELAPGSPVGEAITLPAWAEVVAVAEVRDPTEVDAVADKTIWSREYAEQRLRWKRRDPLTVLALRVHVLDEPIVVPWSDDYGGCTSWVDLAELPDPVTQAARPALSDEAFDARLAGVREVLPSLR